MKTTAIVPINEIYTLDFELIPGFAQRQVWVDGVLFKRERERNASALIYLNGCTGVYTDLVSGESFFAPCKSLVYLPYGGRYTVLNVESKLHDPDAYLVEFNMQKDGEFFALDSKPFLIDSANTHYIEKLMRETVDCYEAVPKSPSLLRSKILEMLMLASHNGHTDKSATHKVLAPALEYMNKYPYDSVSVEGYAEMCGLSYGGFGRLFKKHLGKSPREYIIDNKIASAKMLLEESELSVKEISDILNFESTSYFCRLFKNRNRLSPSQFRSIKRAELHK